MEISDLIAELVQKFPRHRDELKAWAPDYARSLRSADIRASLAATLARWTKASPPRPADFVRKQAGLVEHDGSGPLVLPLTYKHEDGLWRCTRAGFDLAKGIKRRILDSMLLDAPIAMGPDAAVWLARGRDAEAWLLAQHQVIDGQVRAIMLTEAECEIANRAAASDFTPTPEAKAHCRAYDDAMAKGMPWPPAKTVLSEPVQLVEDPDGVYRAQSPSPPPEAPHEHAG